MLLVLRRRLMKSIYTAIAILFLCSNSLPQDGCPCKSAAADEITHGSSVLWSRDVQTVNKIQGQVFLAGSTPVSPIDEALVEVFTYPKSVRGLAVGAAERYKKQKRVAVCKTNEDGEFCFLGIRPGVYELRVSKEGLTVSSGTVILNPRIRAESGRGIQVPMGFRL